MENEATGNKSVRGVFSLTDHLDLYKKLCWDYSQLQDQPTNPYLAYDFFVTAWHLLEWKYPEKTDSSIRNAILEWTPLLEVCEKLAKGALHFEPRAKHLKGTSDTQNADLWKTGVWAPGSWDGVSWGSWLVVNLTGAAQKTYGDQIRVEELARQVMEYWQSSINT